MDKELKRTVRALRKLKRQTRKKTKERRELNRKIREIKKEATKNCEPLTPEKQSLINKIKYFFPDINMDYKQFTLEQLQYHYDKKIKGKLIVNGIINRDRLKEL